MCSYKENSELAVTDIRDESRVWGKMRAQFLAGRIVRLLLIAILPILPYLLFLFYAERSLLKPPRGASIYDVCSGRGEGGPQKADKRNKII